MPSHISLTGRADEMNCRNRIRQFASRLALRFSNAFDCHIRDAASLPVERRSEATFRSEESRKNSDIQNHIILSLSLLKLCEFFIKYG